MLKMFINDIANMFSIPDEQLDYTSMKALLIAMSKHGYGEYKQIISFDEKVFSEIWDIYQKLLDRHFDINYNRKTDFVAFFERLICAKYFNKTLNMIALFCPGYSKNGYKDQLGHTSKWKLEELKKLEETLKEFGITSNIISYYSDAFLENTNSLINPKWEEELCINRNMFHIEGEKYFAKNQIKNVRELEIFSDDRSIDGFVDKKCIDRVNLKTYEIFHKNNYKFYSSLDFSEEEIAYRSDKLVTMYVMFSDYINTIENVVFLPMENMYERENIFSENGTCTMYLKLKR